MDELPLSSLVSIAQFRLPGSLGKFDGRVVNVRGHDGTLGNVTYSLLIIMV